VSAPIDPTYALERAIDPGIRAIDPRIRVHASIDPSIRAIDPRVRSARRP
jgi:hypothetical protein